MKQPIDSQPGQTFHMSIHRSLLNKLIASDGIQAVFPDVADDFTIEDARDYLQAGPEFWGAGCDNIADDGSCLGHPLSSEVEAVRCAHCRTEIQPGEAHTTYINKAAQPCCVDCSNMRWGMKQPNTNPTDSLVVQS